MSLNASYHKEQEYIWFRGGTDCPKAEPLGALGAP